MTRVHVPRQVDLDFRLRAWTDSTDRASLLPPPSLFPSPAVRSNVSTCATANDFRQRGPCHCCPADLHVTRDLGGVTKITGPAPIWDSTAQGGWPAEGKHFSGMEPPMVVPMSSLGAIGLRPTTMMGWCFGAVFDGPDGLSMPSRAAVRTR